MFRSTYLTIFRGAHAVLCAVTTLDSADVRSLFVYVVRGHMSLPSVCLFVCLLCLFVCLELLSG
jgi:hypothetical protein